MKIYIGGTPMKLMVNNNICSMKLVASVPAWLQLITSDEQILQDTNGLNLTAKEAQ